MNVFEQIEERNKTKKETPKEFRPVVLQEDGHSKIKSGDTVIDKLKKKYQHQGPKEKTEPIAFRLGRTYIDKIDSLAKEAGTNRAQVLRDLIEVALRD